MHALMLRCESQSTPQALSSKRFRSSLLLVSMALFSVAGGACNALDKPGPKGSVTLIPVDDRPALLTSAPPVPISGGTLAISSDGATAVAADPDRDRVSVVDLNGGTVQHIALSQGDEPGRVTLDSAGHAFVALRRGGAVAVVDLARAELVERVPVCAAPRGLAFDPAQGLLHVACMEGRLVSLRSPAATAAQPMAAGMQIVRDLHVELDLRDVMLRGDQLWVSTFKRAELLQVSDTGEVRQRISPSMVVQPGQIVSDGTSTSAMPDKTLQPHLAYRSMTDGAGNVLMLHQAESDEEVAIDQPDDSQNSSPYGGSGSCSGIVTPAFTTIDTTGRVNTVAAMTGVLSVDMAFAPDDRLVAIVQAGAADSGAPQRETFFDHEGADFALPGAAPTAFSAGGERAGSVVTVLDTKIPTPGPCSFGSSMFVTGQSTAVAFRPPKAISSQLGGQTGWVVQSREPAQLTLLSLRNEFSGTEPRVIDLGGESVRDSGHDIFHRDAGGGIACASCHAEGGEDGHVWHFTALGARRTQALHVGLEGTAPFHWGGDESDMNKLMSDVFVGRMGGVHQSVERVSALTRWLFALQPPAAPTVTDDAAVERGRELFMSAEVGCASCHSGVKLTNNETVNVGTGEALQVPSLRGIAYRAPFMHDGCARNLRDRFSLVCGGESHGNTRDLSTESIDDLVAYLQTL